MDSFFLIFFDLPTGLPFLAIYSNNHFSKSIYQLNFHLSNSIESSFLYFLRLGLEQIVNSIQIVHHISYDFISKYLILFYHCPIFMTIKIDSPSLLFMDGFIGFYRFINLFLICSFPKNIYLVNLQEDIFLQFFRFISLCLTPSCKFNHL